MQHTHPPGRVAAGGDRIDGDGLATRLENGIRETRVLGSILPMNVAIAFLASVIGSPLMLPLVSTTRATAGRVL